MVTLTGCDGFTIIYTGLDIAGLPYGQVSLDVNLQEIALLFAGTKVKVASVAPGTSFPSIIHWKAGLMPPLCGAAVKSTGVPSHTGLADAATITLTGRSGFTVIVIALDVSGFPVAQTAFDVNMHFTTSLSCGIYVNVTFVSPGRLLPFLFHWYSGFEPPFTGVAVNTTAVPAQTGLEDSATDTLTGMSGLTVMPTVFEVAGFCVAQIALDVTTQFTSSL
jgi:hypothetical protein